VIEIVIRHIYKGKRELNEEYTLNGYCLMLANLSFEKRKLRILGISLTIKQFEFTRYIGHLHAVLFIVQLTVYMQNYNVNFTFFQNLLQLQCKTAHPSYTQLLSLFLQTVGLKL